MYYPDPGILEESFRYGAMAHLMANRQGIYPPLATAIPWAKTNHLRQLNASLLLLAAENYAVLGQTPQAALMLDQARTTIAHRAMGNGRIGARRSFLDGLVFFQQKKIKEGELSVAAAMEYMGGAYVGHLGERKHRLALAVPDRPGRRGCPHQCHGAGGHGHLQGRPPRPTAGRLVLRPDGVAGRVGHAAPAAL